METTQPPTTSSAPSNTQPIHPIAEQTSWLLAQKITISLAEYLLPRCKDKRPAYLDEFAVTQIKSFPNWEDFVVIIHNDIPIAEGNGFIIKNNTPKVYQVWLKQDYLASIQGKDFIKSEVIRITEAETAHRKELDNRLHTQLIKVRLALTKRNANAAQINKLINMAMHPWESAGVELGQGEVILTQEQKDRIAKAMELRKKFGLDNILNEIEKIDNNSKIKLYK